MGVAGQTATTGTGGLVGQLEADREDERQDTFDKRFAIAEQLKVGGLVMKTNGDSAVLSRRFSPFTHVFPSVIVLKRHETP
jgi:hypothetical protein